MTRSALVVGYGSIGSRHARLLAERGLSVSCVTRNDTCPYPRHVSIADAVRACQPDVVVVANPTADHARSIWELRAAGYAGRVLVEKPLTGGSSDPVDAGDMEVFVAYNLRFHPLVLALRSQTEGARILSASFQAGQYLPDWRPGTDYQTSYSARREGGGGVLRDLSHELDLAGWLCGPWQRVAAIVGRFGPLKIETDDTATLLIAASRCPALTICVNYLDRKPRRLISLTCERDGEVFDARLDLIEGVLTVNGNETRATPERDTTYRAQIEALLSDDAPELCRLEEGRSVDLLIAAADSGAELGIWMLKNQTAVR